MRGPELLASEADAAVHSARAENHLELCSGSNFWKILKLNIVSFPEATSFCVQNTLLIRITLTQLFWGKHVLEASSAMIYLFITVSAA